MNLRTCHNFHDFRRLAKRRLPTAESCAYDAKSGRQSA
jgi:hypothetical protein